ncbi:alpha/beta hydrolase [Butyrivibrio sp. AC2005]|uniref:alpha/beta hydrolase n=1 Tax=Butyrivibrio sp. AC2005 TaxID=1280672 RepID=UPI000418839D|nr:alpha/beta hydrolase [Butyrivibrio sp. AC2005]
MRIETITLNKKRNVTLTAMLQDVGGEFRGVTKRPAVFVIPGGGYMFCSDREADPVALPYLKAGYDAFILRYSVKEDSVWPNPLNDYDQAMDYIKERADEWNVMTDKIAVIGFSAGGHLAGAAATMSKNRPAAAILGYAVLREDTTHEISDGPSIVDAVDEKTCPCFLFATRTDNVVPIQNTLDMMSALNRHNTSFECHIYDFGPHGFSTGDTSIQAKSTLISERAKNWVEDSIGWLRDVMGDFDENGLTKPVCKAHITDDGEQWLSLDCTLRRIFGNPEAVKVLADTIERMRKEIKPFSPEMTFDDMMLGVLGKMKMRDLLAERGIDIDKFDEMDEKLSKIPNI